MPPLADFGDSALNPLAACQQMAAIQMVYRHDQFNLQNLLGPDDGILHFRTANTTWPPDFAIVRSLPNRYFVILAGTVGPLQLTVQSNLGNVIISQGVGGGYTGAIWKAAADEIEAVVNANVPLDNPATRIYVSGHSYGGIVAQLLSLRFARRLGAARVQLLTFAQPKGLTPGYSREEPAVYWRVRSNLDAVPGMYLDTPGLIIVDPAKPQQWFDATTEWIHRGSDTPLDVYGVVGGGADDASPRPDGVLVGPVAEHYPENYLARVRQYAIRQGGGAAALDAVAAAYATRAATPHETFRGEWSLFDLGLPVDVLPDLIGRLHLFAGGNPGGGFSMSLQKHTLIFTGPDSEQWTESYVVDANSDLNAAVFGIKDDFLKFRLTILHKSYTLRAVRASNLTPPKLSAVRLLSMKGLATGNENNPGPDVGGITAVHRLVCVDGARRSIWFRGYADSAIDRTLAGKDTDAGVLGPNTKAWIKALADAGYGVARRKKEGEGDNLDARHATRVDGTVKPGQSLIYMESVTGFAAKDTVVLSQFSKKDLPGLNGIFEVVSVVDNVGIYVRYRTPLTANLPNQPGLVRRVQRHAVSPFNPDRCVCTHYGTRKTKRGFTGSRGGSPAKRVRHLA